MKRLLTRVLEKPKHRQGVDYPGVCVSKHYVVENHRLTAETWLSANKGSNSLGWLTRRDRELSARFSIVCGILC